MSHSHCRQKPAFSLYTTYILGRSNADNWMPQAKVFFEVWACTEGEGLGGPCPHLS